jgi:hypothetical protein
MTITLTPELANALNERALEQGIAPEDLALLALREKFLAQLPIFEARDEWERMVLDVGTDCGVSLSKTALSSEGLYE